MATTAKGRVLLQAKLEDSELQVKELSRQVMALERAKVELEARNRQLESAAHTGKDAPGAGTAGPAGTPQVSQQSWSLPLVRFPWVDIGRLPVFASFQSSPPGGQTLGSGRTSAGSLVWGSLQADGQASVALLIRFSTGLTATAACRIPATPRRTPPTLRA